MKLIKAVNEVLMKVGESRVRSVNANDTAKLTAIAVKNSYTSLCSEAPMPFSKKALAFAEYNNGIAELPGYVLEVERVMFNTRRMIYVPNDVFYSSDLYEGEPRLYTFFGRTVHLSPVPRLEHYVDINYFCRVCPAVDEGDDTYEIDIPEVNEYLLVLRACVTMCVDHIQDSQRAREYSQELARLLGQQSHFVQTDHSISSLL